MALLDHCAEQAAVTGQQPLTTSELQWINAYWRACNYLLREPLRPEHIKNRLLGHWGSDPGQNFTWAHLNRAIRKYDLNMIYISGPGHGAPAMIANAYLEGTYSEVYSEKSQDEAGIEAVRQTRDEIRKQVLQLLCNSITVSQREYCTVILRRVSNYQTLDGTGGLYVSGRWHTKGHPVVYCTMNPATALLETLVHMEIDSEERPERFQMLRIEGPDTLSIEEIEAGGLAPNWAEGLTSTQSIGDRWLSEGRSLLLQVPGILVPETWNVLVNPQHAEAKLLEITMAYEHVFDARLL